MTPLLRFINVFLLCALCSSCTTVPLTGRKQLDFIPNETMLSMSYQQYGDFLKSNKLSSNQTQISMVKRVGEKIQKAVEKYMTDNHLANRLKNYQWEFSLVEDNAVNAWCMPGGKVVVYTGIMPIAQDDNGLAVVMSHEIAHAIAKHGSERMSQGLLTDFGGAALSTAMQNKPAATKQLWMTVFGGGAQYGVLLSYSRLQETEADHLGLIFMSMAGYDPNTAVAFWERMAKASAGKAPFEFLSTHPSDKARINKIKEAIPEAMKYYQK